MSHMQGKQRASASNILFPAPGFDHFTEHTDKESVSDVLLEGNLSALSRYLSSRFVCTLEICAVSLLMYISPHACCNESCLWFLHAAEGKSLNSDFFYHLVLCSLSAVFVVEKKTNTEPIRASCAGLTREMSSFCDPVPGSNTAAQVDWSGLEETTL